MTNYIAESNQFNELKTIDPVRQEILDGLCYYSGYLFSAIADDASANAFLRTGSEKCKFKFFVDSTRTIDIYFYSAATFDASGNELSVLNYNLNSTNTFGGHVYRNPTIDTLGNLVGYKRLFATTTNPVRGGSTSTEGEFSRILVPNTNYLMQIFNRSGSGAADIFLSVRLCELPEYDD